MRTFTFCIRAALTALLVATAAPAAIAQTTTPITTQTTASPSTPSPLTVEPIPNRFVVAPEFKVTEFDDGLGQLAGLYAGRMLDDTLFVGGAGYWLANGSDAFKLAYGGLLVGWSSPPAHRIRFGLRGLAGGGTATLPVEFGGALRGGTLRGGAEPVPFARFGGRGDARVSTFASPTVRLRVSDDFFVVEPQGTVAFLVTDHVNVTFGAGYRAVAFTDVLRDRVDGASGSLAVEVDW